MVTGMAAGVARMMVAVVDEPPFNVGEASCNETDTLLTARVAVPWAPLRLAVMVTFVSAAGFVVLMVNVAEGWKAGIVTLAGSEAMLPELLVSRIVLLDERVAERVTVPVTLAAPDTLDGTVTETEVLV